MKQFSHLSLACLFSVISMCASAQLDCTDSLTYVPSSAEFTQASLSSSDSAVNFRVVNTSSTYYVYPHGRAMPVTALPPGMSPVQAWGWHVFQSSWNPGDTAFISTSFTVNQPIPANYMVDFELWINYNEPLQDSCKFPFTVTLNLNPQSPTSVSAPDSGQLRIYPNPASGRFRIQGLDAPAKVQVRDLQGRLVATFSGNDPEFTLPALAPGRYFVTVLEESGPTTLPLGIQ